MHIFHSTPASTIFRDNLPGRFLGKDGKVIRWEAVQLKYLVVGGWFVLRVWQRGASCWLQRNKSNTLAETRSPTHVGLHVQDRRTLLMWIQKRTRAKCTQQQHNTGVMNNGTARYIKQAIIPARRHTAGGGGGSGGGGGGGVGGGSSACLEYNGRQPHGSLGNIHRTYTGKITPPHWTR